MLLTLLLLLIIDPILIPTLVLIIVFEFSERRPAVATRRALDGAIWGLEPRSSMGPYGASKVHGVSSR
eukprot:6866943-Pyramimonas_sp.AAC.1